MRISLLGSGSETLLLDLETSGIKFIRHRPPTGIILNTAGETIQIMKDIGEVIPWGSLAAVLVAWLKYRSTRKLIMTQEDNTIIHAEGFNVKELERLLPSCKNASVIEMKKLQE